MLVRLLCFQVWYGDVVLVCFAFVSLGLVGWLLCLVV